MGVDNILCGHYLVYSCKILSRGCRGGMGMVVVTTMGSDNGIKDKILGMRLNRKQTFVVRRYSSGQGTEVGCFNLIYDNPIVGMMHQKLTY